MTNGLTDELNRVIPTPTIRIHRRSQQCKLMNKLRVFADFHNADAKGRVRLNCAGTIADLECPGIVLQDGQLLIIYSEELEVEGVVHYSEEEKLWTAVIDWNAIREVDSVVPQIIPQARDIAS